MSLLPHWKPKGVLARQDTESLVELLNSNRPSATCSLSYLYPYPYPYLSICNIDWMGFAQCIPLFITNRCYKIGIKPVSRPVSVTRWSYESDLMEVLCNLPLHWDWLSYSFFDFFGFIGLDCMDGGDQPAQGAVDKFGLKENDNKHCSGAMLQSVGHQHFWATSY